MSNTLLGFGLFALVAAIVGGGLKAFGFEVGPLKSTGRQLVLAAVGLVLIGSAEWSPMQGWLFPPPTIVGTWKWGADPDGRRTQWVTIHSDGTLTSTISMLNPDGTRTETMRKPVSQTPGNAGSALRSYRSAPQRRNTPVIEGRA